MRKVLSILCCILWMTFIFYNSSQDGIKSNGLTYKVLEKIIHSEARIELKLNQLKLNIFKYDKRKNDEEEIINNKEENTTEEKKVVVHANTYSYNQIVKFNKIIRKIAHGIEYFILAIFFAEALFAIGLSGKGAIIYILFAVLFYSATDELHQLYLVGRESSVVDIFIDFIGGIFGILFFYLVYYKIFKITYKGKKVLCKRIYK